MVKNSLSVPRNNPLLYVEGEQTAPQTTCSSGKISNALSKVIIYERTPSIFDTKEIQQRDKELKELHKLKEQDAKLCIDRKDKPVYLTYAQTRTLYALSYAISQVNEPDVKEKIANPFKKGISISRTLDIHALTKFLNNGKNRESARKILLKSLFDLSHIRQVQIIHIGGEPYKITAPFIHIDETLEQLEKDGGVHLVNVTFGSTFFAGLDKRFAHIPPKLFEVWGKKGRQTELFSILLSSLLNVYWYFRKAADNAEARVKEEIDKVKRISEEEYREKIKSARQEALRYEVNSETLKKRLTTDYDSDRRYNAKFKKDLQNAVEGLIEADLLRGYYIQKGAKGQEKIIFYLSDTYNFSQKLIEEASAIMKVTEEDEDEIAAF